VTLTFNILTLKLVRIIICGLGNLSYLYQFCCFWDFSFSTYGQHLADGPRDVVTMIFDFGGHGAARDAAVHAPRHAVQRVR